LDKDNDGDSGRNITEIVNREFVPEDHGENEGDSRDEPEDDFCREAQDAQHALRLAELLVLDPSGGIVTTRAFPNKP